MTRLLNLPPPLAKPSTSRVKNEPPLPEKEGSVTSGKAPVCTRARKGTKAPIIKVLTLCHKKGVTPPPAVISEDTHADPRGRSPTPITAELMLDRIFTDLPLLSALCLPHKVCYFLLLLRFSYTFPSRRLLAVLCVLAIEFCASTKNRCPCVQTVAIGDTVPAVSKLTIYRMSVIICCRSPKLHTLVRTP